MPVTALVSLFPLLRWFRFACFGGFVLVVSFRSFRSFRFVVSGFSACPQIQR